MQATERNFCISCNESIKRGRIPTGGTWANPCSVNASFAGQSVSAGLRYPSWLQPQLSFPAPYWTRRLGGSRALGQSGAVLSAMAGACETPYGGKNPPPLKPPWCRDLLQVRFASDCLVLLWLSCRSVRAEPPKCDGTRRDSPAGEVPPLGMHQGPPSALKPPKLCLLHWARLGCGHGTLGTPHWQPLQSSCIEFWLLLGTARLEGCQGSRGKSPPHLLL